MICVRGGREGCERPARMFEHGTIYRALPQVSYVYLLAATPGSPQLEPAKVETKYLIIVSRCDKAIVPLSHRLTSKIILFQASSRPPTSHTYRSMLKHSRFASLAAKLRVERYIGLSHR